ncbi:glycosyltransferase [Ekhidna sp. To15]|uniref:glycosyltransferase n=1 Tax=Ekhidna sp. To15 TaxID=3395267 RepID=UPI003F51F8D3
MKVAYVHDDLMRRGGAERVLLSLHKIYPEASIYTLAYKKNRTYPEFMDMSIKTSMFQVLAINETIMKWLFYPLGVWAMKRLDLTAYDLVIISTTFGGKYVKVSPGAKVYTYCYTPFRLVWRPESYNVYQNSKGLKRKIFDVVIKRLKNIDLKASKRTDYFIAMTKAMKQRIIDAYHPRNEIYIINPPVNFLKFHVSSEVDDYYLVVSRFEPYKKVDLVIETFNRNGKKLVIVGNGSQEKYLKSIAATNIVFKQGLSQDQLAKTYSKCRALIFPQHEDYGLTPLEANASGRPVIAYKGGGVNDTMIEYVDNDKNSTAVLFNNQTVKDIQAAVDTFEELSFDPNFLRSHAEKFSETQFIMEIEKFINSTKNLK